MNKILIVILFSLALPTTLFAWGNRTAHPALNGQAYKLYLEQYQTATKGGGSLKIDEKAVFKGPGVTDAGKVVSATGTLTLTIGDWLTHGGFSADEPEAYAAWRHFYDPHSANGMAWLTDHVPDGWGINPKVDARTWALSHADNLYNWQVAFSAFREAFEGKTEKTAEAYARAFRAIGESMHMLADMTQPAHVRNDAHARAEPIEDTLDQKMVGDLARGAVDPRLQLDGKSVAELFDVVARFVNENFYSADTIYNAASPEVLPANGQAPNQSPQFSTLTVSESTGVYYADFNSQQIPLAMETYSSYFARTNNYPDDSPQFMVPQFFTKKQASVLVPIAVQANRLLLASFVPKLQLAITQTAGEGEKIAVEGAMIHESEGTPWSTPLSYSGPGKLFKRVYGKDEGELLGEVTFKEGKVVTPLQVSPQSDSAQVYLQVRAGGLIIESKDVDLSGTEEVICPPWKDYAIYLSVCVDNKTLYQCCVPTATTTCETSIDGPPVTCEKGCKCSSFADMGFNYFECLCAE